MDNQVERLLAGLDDEMEVKCTEIRQKKAQAVLHRLFILLCGLLLVVPVVMVFLGLNLFTVFVPVILFFTIGFLLLSPVLLTNDREERFQ